MGVPQIGDLVAREAEPGQRHVRQALSHQFVIVQKGQPRDKIVVLTAIG